MKKEVISRCIINILDVKHSYNYKRFENNNLYQELLDYGRILYNEDIYTEYKKVIEKNKTIINNIANDNQYTYEDYNMFMEQLRQFKRTYILKQ